MQRYTKSSIIIYNIKKNGIHQRKSKLPIKKNLDELAEQYQREFDDFNEQYEGFLPTEEEAKTEDIEAHERIGILLEKANVILKKLINAQRENEDDQKDPKEMDEALDMNDIQRKWDVIRDTINSLLSRELIESVFEASEMRSSYDDPGTDSGGNEY